MTHELRVKERDKRKNKGILTNNATDESFINCTSLHSSVPIEKIEDMFSYLKKGNKSKLRYRK